MLTYAVVLLLQHVKMRQKAIRLLAKHTDTSIRELREDDEEMLRGAMPGLQDHIACVCFRYLAFLVSACRPCCRIIANTDLHFCE